MSLIVGRMCHRSSEERTRGEGGRSKEGTTNARLNLHPVGGVSKRNAHNSNGLAIPLEHGNSSNTNGPNSEDGIAHGGVTFSVERGVSNNSSAHNSEALDRRSINVTLWLLLLLLCGCCCSSDRFRYYAACCYCSDRFLYYAACRVNKNNLI